MKIDYEIAQISNEPSDEVIDSLVNLFTAGIPLPRIAEIIDIPVHRINSWLEKCDIGDKRFSNLRDKLIQASAKNEIRYIQNLQALADPKQTYKTIRRSFDKNGNISKTESIESEQKPDYRAITFLLKLQSPIYREADQSSSSVNVNVATQTIVQLPSNGREIKPQN